MTTLREREEVKTPPAQEVASPPSGMHARRLIIYSALVILVLAVVGLVAIVTSLGDGSGTADSSSGEPWTAGQVTIPTVAMNRIPSVTPLAPAQHPAVDAFEDHLRAHSYYGQTKLPRAQVQRPDPDTVSYGIHLDANFYYGQTRLPTWRPASGNDYFPTPSSGPR